MQLNNRGVVTLLKLDRQRRRSAPVAQSSEACNNVTLCSSQVQTGAVYRR
jgi:hypothetical protein